MGTGIAGYLVSAGKIENVMACPQIPDIPAEEFGHVVRKWHENRIPLSGSMELDLRCNLRCHHCYRQGDWPPRTMSTGEVKSILDQIADAGTLWILFTGGEVFLRRDFFEIYEHAVGLGLLVTLFTNGTLVTEKIADRLGQRPPYNIEITLYGYSRETYENVTGVAGSWARCYRGVDLLLDRGLPLRLKTVVMRTNRHELMDMHGFAESRGVRFKYDTMINPGFGGSLSPCNVRLSPAEVVEADFAIPSRLDEYRRFFEPRKDFRTRRVFSCGAGSQTFHIDPYGNMSPCLLLREPRFSLREMRFGRIWNEMFPPIYDRMRGPDHPCNACNLSSLCGSCPAWSELEMGDIEARVEYCCDVGHRRAKRLGYGERIIDQATEAAVEPTGEKLVPVLQARVGGRS